MNVNTEGASVGGGKGTQKMTDMSSSAQGTAIETPAHLRSAEHITSGNHSRELSPSSSGRRRSAPQKYSGLVLYTDEESDTMDQAKNLKNDAGMAKGVATRTRTKKKKVLPTGGDEDESYEPEAQKKSTQRLEKAAAQPGSKRTRSKPAAKEANEILPRWKKKNLNPEGATTNFYKEQAKDHRRYLKSQEAELKEKDEEIRQLREEKATLQGQLKAMDEEIIQPKSRGQVSRIDDSVLRDKLDGHAKEWRDWAIDWAHQGPLAEKLSLGEKRKLTDLFLGHSSAIAKARPISRAGFIELWTKQEGACLLLHTFLAHSICGRLLAKPFLLLLGLGNEADSKDDFPVMLTKLGRSISEADKVEGRSWRAHTLKLLDRSIKQLGTVIEQDAADDFGARKDTLCTALAQEIMNNDAIHGLFRQLSSEEVTKCYNELLSIIRKAVTQFTELWLQEVVIHTWGKTAADLHRPFRNNDEIMIPHPIMRLKPNDHSLDGQKILLIVQPAIEVMELRSPSQCFDKQWLKALVYVSRQRRPPQSQGEIEPENDKETAETMLERNTALAKKEQQVNVSVEQKPETAQSALSQVAPSNGTKHGGPKYPVHLISSIDASVPAAAETETLVSMQHSNKTSTRSEAQAGGSSHNKVSQHEDSEPPAKRRKTGGPLAGEEDPIDAADKYQGTSEDLKRSPAIIQQESGKERTARKAKKVVEEILQKKAERVASIEPVLPGIQGATETQAEPEKQVDAAHDDEVEFLGERIGKTS